MLLAATGDDRLDPSLAELLAVFVMVVAAIGVERIRTLGAGRPSAGSQAGGQVAQGRGGHIDAGRVDQHAEAPGRTGDLGREPVYQGVSRPDTGPHLNHPPPYTGWKMLTDGDEADGHPFSLVSRIRGGPIGPCPPWPRG